MSSVVCEISAGHTEKLGRPATSSAVTQCPASDGSQAKDLPMTLDSTDIALSHSTRTEMMIVPQTENMGYLARTLVEVEGPVSDGPCIDEPPILLGKAETEGDRATNGLELFEYVLSLSRVGNADLGIQNGDEGDWVDCASDVQGIDTSHQTNQLSVLALTEADMVNAEMGLGNGDSFSPLMTINPLGLVVLDELNCDNEVMGFGNTLNISNRVKHRLPDFSKMMGLSLGRHEKMCIMLLQRLEGAIEAANLMHRRDIAHRKVVSKDKGKRELRNLISSINYDDR